MDKGIEKLANDELKRASDKFGAFHSSHEGYAIVAEEMDELNENIASLNEYIDALWIQTKANGKNKTVPNIKNCIRCLNYYATEAIKEAVQVLAMVKRYEQDLINSKE